MSLRSAVRRLRLRPVHTQPSVGACSKMYSAVASSSKAASDVASTAPILTTPADYSALFRALGHRKFSENYSPNTHPVALAQRTSITPRQLYAKMRAIPLRRATENALLTTALRAFVRLEDYAAALVVLRDMPATPGGARLTERAQTTEAALHSLACRIYLERNAIRRRLTRELLGVPSLPAAGWGLGSGTWRMPERADWVIEKLLKYNRPKANAPAAGLVGEVEADLRPLVFILRQVLKMHGGVGKRRNLRPWREEEVRAKAEMEPVTTGKKNTGEGQLPPGMWRIRRKVPRDPKPSL
ncbi:hypothetical protein MVEN_00201000 [Mycena venus]|uniref:Uncharacterized protein n=1 Tax=Mycena venus TaxID=2733690 RepID=A0A8H6Z0J8_9AGAR|nr:hypothetical protein MVEN_00201000 [Mycena venus]